MGVSLYVARSQDMGDSPVAALIMSFWCTSFPLWDMVTLTTYFKYSTTLFIRNAFFYAYVIFFYHEIIVCSSQPPVRI